ncbi:MAG: hypothetical protein M5R40_24655 [Anaerolineae bacterium]|nr:hypothetical protein [Anaerolineae bacterium]
MGLAVFGIDDFRATEITFDTVLRNLTYFRVFEKVTAWLVGFVGSTRLGYLGSEEQNILVTGLDEWDELKG